MTMNQTSFLVTIIVEIRCFKCMNKNEISIHFYKVYL